MLKDSKYKIALGAFIGTMVISTGVTTFFIIDKKKKPKIYDLTNDLLKFNSIKTNKTDAELELMLHRIQNPTSEELGYAEPMLTPGVKAIYSLPEIYTGGTLRLHVHLDYPGQNTINNDRDFILNPPIESTKNRIELKGMIDNQSRVPLTSALLGITLPNQHGTSSGHITGSYDGKASVINLKLDGKDIFIAPRRYSSLAPWTVSIGDSFISTKFKDGLIASLGTKTTVTAAELGFEEPYPWPNDQVSATYQIEAYTGENTIKVNFTLAKAGITQPVNNKGSFILHPRLPISLAPWLDELEHEFISIKTNADINTIIGTKLKFTASELGVVEPSDWTLDSIKSSYEIVKQDTNGDIHARVTISLEGYSHLRNNVKEITIHPKNN